MSEADNGMPKQRTRRQWRRDRPVLVVGTTGLQGTVKRFFPEKQYGYIQPINNAARIRFSLMDVPFARQTCIAEGKTVFFTVAVQKSGRLIAIIT